MVTAAKRARLFQRENVGRLLHDAEQLAGARLVGADFTELGGRKKAALHAGMNRRPRLGDGARDPFRLLLARLHHPERDALSRTRTDPRHLAQLRDQVAEGDRVLGPFQSGTSGSATGVGSVAICRQRGSSRRKYHCSGRSGAGLSAWARLNSAQASFQRRSRK